MSGRPKPFSWTTPGWTIPVWAPNANYPAGSDPWSANPCKVVHPGAASVGFTPDTGAAAENFNQNFFDAFTTDDAAKSWASTHKSEVQTDANALRAFVALQQFELKAGGALFSRYLPSTKLWYGDITAFRAYVGGTNVIPSQGGAAITNVHGSNVDESGNIVQLGTGVDGDKVTEFNVGTQTWTKRTGIFSPALQTGSVEFDPVSGLWCAVAIRTDTHAAHVYTSWDRATWTQRTPPAMPSTGTTGPLSGLGSDRAGKLVMASTKGLYIGELATESVSFSLSTDGGVTWSTPDTHVTTWTLTASSGEPPIPHWDGTKWVCVITNQTDNASYVYNSDDGATWTQVAHLTGACIAGTIGVDPDSGLLAGTTKDAQAVYSEDHGATWKRVGFATSGTGAGAACAAGRFFFSLGGTIYMGLGSGVEAGGTL
jgi:hypothetical protein